MCDARECHQLYEEAAQLTPEEAFQLTQQTENEDERRFFMMLGNYLLQKKQREVIAGNLF